MNAVARAVGAWCNPGLAVAAIAACGDMLAVGSVDGSVAVLHAGSLQLLQLVPAPTAAVGLRGAAARLSFSADAEQLAVGYSDSSLAIWSLTEPHGQASPHVRQRAQA